MRERALSPVIRIAAGVVGAIIFIIALLIAASQVRAGWGSDLRAWLAAIALLIVALAALRLVRAAVRGTIRVRGGGMDADDIGRGAGR
jgi:hypothetical protein